MFKSKGNITRKIEVQKDLKRYSDVTVKYFELIKKFVYNFLEALFPLLYKV